MRSVRHALHNSGKWLNMDMGVVICDHLWYAVKVEGKIDSLLITKYGS